MVLRASLSGGLQVVLETKPMRVEEFAPEKAWWDHREETEQAWQVPVEDIIANGYNLDIKNPNTPEDTHEDPLMLLGRYQEAVKAAEAARYALKSASWQRWNGIMDKLEASSKGRYESH